MMRDPRSLSREADQAVRDGRYATAVQTYLFVAAHFADEGFALKAAALLRQVVDVVDRHAPELADSGQHALERLVELYSGLGLQDEADEARRRLGNG
jgi:hypothetical protein